MKKILVEVANLDAHVCSATNSLYADGSIILTPGAKDALSKRKIKLVYGPKPQACPPDCTCPACLAAKGQAPAPCPAGCTCPACLACLAAKGTAAACPEGCTCPTCTARNETEELLIAVAATLKNEYGITDPETLKSASCQIVKTLKDSM